MILNMLERISRLIDRLVQHAYRDIDRYTIDLLLGETSAFAEVSWKSHKTVVNLRLNRLVTAWHEAPITGLLAHELSHVSADITGFSEEETDLDVIERGLGIYLATERILTGKYSDHVMDRGRDRYLGYSTIRAILSDSEIVSLDRLLSDFAIVPKDNRPNATVHDIAIMCTDISRIIQVDGRRLVIENIDRDSDIRIVVRESSTDIFIDDILLESL